MLVRYFVRLSLQSLGSTLSSCEVVKASGYEACLSTEMENFVHVSLDESGRSSYGLPGGHAHAPSLLSLGKRVGICSTI